MFGSGRAILSLRDSYRSHLRQVRQATGFQYMRFHAIFHDEVGLYDEDPSGKPVYNFSYVNQIYDGLLQSGVRPFVELSFMPRKLAAQPTEHVFWYHPIISPPKDWDAWSNMITAFTQHLVARYGIDEVSQWYFEVWNEPNLDFWSGDPVSGAHPCGSISVSSDSPLPVHPVENLLREVGDFGMREMRLTGEHAAEQDGRIDRGNLRLPQPLARIDIGPVIEKAALVVQLLPQESQSYQRAVSRLRIGDIPAVLADAQSGEPESGGGDAADDFVIAASHVAPVFRKPGAGIRLFPEIKKVGGFQIFQKSAVARGQLIS